MKSIEKEAYVWYNRELLTLERAEEHLLRKRARSGALGEIRRLLQIKDRNFSPTERKYAESWLDMGFSLEAIALAYDKTVVKTGALKWPYMNSILQSWHGKNLHSLEEITRGDLQQTYQMPGRTNRAESVVSAGERLRDDAELMRKLLDRSKGG
jgi:DnaD/phage-associated family protein